MKKLFNTKVRQIISSVLAVQMIQMLAGCSGKQSTPSLPQEAYDAQKLAMQAEEQEKAATDAIKQEILNKLLAVKDTMGDFKVYQLGDNYYTLGTLQDSQSSEDFGTIKCEQNTESSDSNMLEIDYTTFSDEIVSAIKSGQDMTGSEYYDMSALVVDSDKLSETIEQNYDFAGKFASNIREAFNNALVGKSFAAGEAAPKIDDETLTEAIKSIFTVKDAAETDMRVLDSQGNEHNVMKIDLVFDASSLGIAGLDAEYIYRTIYYVENEEQCLIVDSQVFNYNATGNKEIRHPIEVAMTNILPDIQTSIANELVENPAMSVDDIKSSIVSKLASSAEVAVTEENSTETSEDVANTPDEQSAGDSSGLKDSLNKVVDMNNKAADLSIRLLNGKVYLGDINKMPQSIQEIKLSNMTATPESASQSNEGEATPETASSSEFSENDTSETDVETSSEAVEVE